VQHWPFVYNLGAGNPTEQDGNILFCYSKIAEEHHKQRKEMTKSDFNDSALVQLQVELQTHNGTKLEAILLRLIREGIAFKSALVPDLQKMLLELKLARGPRQ
jgi:hypothetical protein